MKATSLIQQLTALLLATLLPLLTQCGGIGGYKSIHYSKGKLSTPPTTLSQRDYPFDAKGRYRTDWVKGGSTRKRSMSSFRSSAASPAQPSLAQNTTPPPPAKSRTIKPRVPISSSRKSKASTPSTAMTVAANTSRQRKQAPPASAPKPVYTPPPAPSPPKPKAPAASKPKARYHTIAKGDTLWGISRKYKVAIPAIKSANGLNTDLIRPGQTLRIP